MAMSCWQQGYHINYRSKINKISLKGTESNKVLNIVGIVIYHIIYRNSYDVHNFWFWTCHDRGEGEEGVKYGATDWSQADLTVDTSKLLLYELAQ